MQLLNRFKSPKKRPLNSRCLFFFLSDECFRSKYLHHQLKPGLSMSHPTSIPSGWLGHSKWHTLQQIWKAMATKHLLGSDRTKCVGQIFLNTASLYVSFKHTFNYQTSITGITNSMRKICTKVKIRQYKHRPII